VSQPKTIHTLRRNSIFPLSFREHVKVLSGYTRQWTKNANKSGLEYADLSGRFE
jgi:hypothetical protein